MFIVMCKDLGLVDCLHIAKALTEEEVILLLMEHLMKTHPEKVGELMSIMNKDGIVEMMRREIQKEIVSN